MGPKNSIDDPPAIQIVKRYFDKLSEDPVVNLELLESIEMLFKRGKLSSHQEIAKVIEEAKGELDED